MDNLNQPISVGQAFTMNGESEESEENEDFMHSYESEFLNGLDDGLANSTAAQASIDQDRMEVDSNDVSYQMTPIAFITEMVSLPYERLQDLMRAQDKP